MSSTNTPDSDAFKQAMKEALRETLDERRDWLREMLVEAVEDVALLDAIREGEQTELVDREQVTASLKGKA